MKNGLLMLLMMTMSVGLKAQTEAQKNQAAQEAERKAKMEASMKLEDKEGWVRKAGIGLDLGQLINVNPYIGCLLYTSFSSNELPNAQLQF